MTSFETEFQTDDEKAKENERLSFVALLFIGLLIREMVCDVELVLKRRMVFQQYVSDV